MELSRLIIVRHGDSEWNQKNLFCGWFDSNLSVKGYQEAENAAEILKEHGYKFNEVHTSFLKRAQFTVETILKKTDQDSLPIYKSWRLNERHYGALTGLNKAETAAKYGEVQVKIWRRSFNVSPPAMTEDHPYYYNIVEDLRYNGILTKDEFPMSESLEMTINRTLPYWNGTVLPKLKQGNSILIVGHSNSLRGIVKHLDGLSDRAIMELNLPTGIPFVYEFDNNMKPVISMKFLGDEKTVKKAMEAVAAQGKVNQ